MMKIVLTFLFTIHSLCAYQAVTLDQCIEAALGFNEKISQGELKVLIQQAKLQETWSFCLPSLDAHADIIAAGDVDTFYRDHRATNFKASLKMPLYTFGYGANLINAQRDALASSQIVYGRIYQEVAFVTKESYYSLLTALKMEQVVEDAILTLKEQLDVATHFHKLGMIHENDVLVLELQLANREYEKVMAAQRSTLALAKLNRLTGLHLCLSLDFEDEFMCCQGLPCFETMVQEVIEAHPDLLALREELNGAKHRFLAEKASRYPKIYAFSDYSTTNAYALPFTQGINVGIGINMNIFDGFASQAKISQREREWELLSSQYEQARRDLILRLESAYLESQAAKHQMPLAEKALVLAEKSVEVAKKQFQEGLISIYDFLEQVRALTQAKAKYFKGMYDCLKAEAALEFAKGV